ncbi:group II intron maturase-specific domain-containing protein [Micromonospora sicca]|nr:group II intron maturase-specific domain-containing protein [Micromonospora sp. 4G53]
MHDPATLVMAFDRVAGNRGARTPGVDGLTVDHVEESIGVRGLLTDLRARLKAGTFRPLPVRERKIPKPGGSGKVRRLGIPTVADRVVQAALKLVLEPIFEADFEPVSYGFRPQRRAQDAIADIHLYGTNGYRWVLGGHRSVLRLHRPHCVDGPRPSTGEGQTRAGTGEGVPQSRSAHGWANYFRHAVAKHTVHTLDRFAWQRLIRMLMHRHRWNWKAVRRRFTTPTGRWLPITADGTEHRPIAAIPVTRYRRRTIPGPWPAPDNA